LSGARAIHILRQDEVNTVAREHKACNAGQCRYRNRDRTHARAKCRCKETAIARGDKRTLGNRLACRDRIAHNGTNQRRSLVRLSVLADEIGFLDQLGRPGLIADGILRKDGADRQRTRGDDDLRTGGYRLLSDGRGAAPPPENMLRAMKAVTAAINSAQTSNMTFSYP